jgi:hypothetical protein
MRRKKSVRVCYSLTREYVDYLRDYSDEIGEAMSEVLRRAIDNYRRMFPCKTKNKIGQSTKKRTGDTYSGQKPV